MGRRMRKIFAQFSIFLLFIQLFFVSANVSAAEEQPKSPIVNGNDVTFIYVGTGNEQSVLLAGSFNDWKTDGDSKIALVKGENGIWSVTKELPNGQYQYKFVVDGKWVTDPLNPNTIDDGYGGKNSVVAVGNTVTQPAPRSVTLVGSLQDELGAAKEWDPAAPETKMTDRGNGLYTLTGKLPAGTYEYKIAINGSWDENYGAGGVRDGANIRIVLDKETTVTFYYHDRTHAVADSTTYSFIPEDKQPRLVGTILPAIGYETENDGWTPQTSTAFLIDDNFDSIYTFTARVPKGDYEYKITLGNNWEENYPSENAKLHVLEDTTITFFFNAKTKEVYTDYNPNGSDGVVQKDQLEHNTWDLLYRQPFGAVKAGTEVTLRLAAKKGDITKADVYVKNTTTGTAKLYPMKKAGVLGEKEYWEATFIPSDKGVYGYKFIVSDEGTKAEYGEDAQEGQYGKAVDKNAELFQLTVYDPNYKTPDWMKEAVVYQIFPDRFYNGNKDNDNVKEKARGNQAIEHKKWSDLPDNPRLYGTPGYDGDNEWSNDFFGGDIAGIEQKLDYLQSLGVNTIYLNPIALAPSNHKYDATDYKQLDPMFGSPEEFQSFVQAVAKRGMHLILDGVFNHVSDDSIYFDRYGKYKTVGAYEYWSAVYDLMNEKGYTEQQARKEVEQRFQQEGQIFSPYGFHLWFNIENKKVDGHYQYQSWWGYDSLPEIKSVEGKSVPYASELNNEQFANYIFRDRDSVAKSWIERGASGWRLDVANEVDSAFWREFRKELLEGEYYRGATLKQGEQPLILGEIWDDASQYFLGDQYDSVMNYRFRGAVLDFLRNGKAEEADARLMAIKEDYPREAYYALMNLIGSHDTARAVFLLGGGTDSFERAEQDPNYNAELGKQRLKLAAIFQMGYPGAPTIYYGDEAGVTGSKDPDNRRTYPWGSEDQDLLDHYKKVGQIRRQHLDVLAHGDIRTVYAKGDVYVFARQYGQETALIAINRGNDSAEVDLAMKEIVPNGTMFTDELNGGYTLEVKDGKASLAIPALSGRMLFAKTSAALPSPVTNLQAKAQPGKVTLTWEGDASSYRVYKSTLKGAGYELVQETAEKSVTVSSLMNGVAYYFAVAAVDGHGNESQKTETQRVIPHYPINEQSIQSVADVQGGTLDLSKPVRVEATIFIEGATEQGQAEGLQAVLQVKGPNDHDWIDYPAVYDRQNGGANVFAASFTPMQPGTYTYRYAVTTNLGESWAYSEEKTVQFVADTTDQTPPANGIDLKQPAVESGQVNLSWTFAELDEQDAYMIAIKRDGAVIKTLTALATSFTDYDVENGKEYTYEISVYDRAGNAVTSNAVKIKPDIVMVKVTFKLHAPSYTPLDARITIPSSLNGWNTGAWEMSRNGAVTTDWEFTKEIQEGETITYKYVKGGSWDQEGLPDHTRNDATDDDVSYYGYGAIGTDLKVTVHNEGNNQMIVRDTILRWIDMPVVVENVKKEGNRVTVTGNAIKGGVLTINGDRVAIHDDMSFAHTFTVKDNQKEVAVFIEPSKESKENIFRNDGGAIAKNTKQYVLDLASGKLREGTVSVEPTPNPGSGNTGDTPNAGGGNNDNDPNNSPATVENGKVMVHPEAMKVQKRQTEKGQTEKIVTLNNTYVPEIVKHLSPSHQEIVLPIGQLVSGEVTKTVIPATLFINAVNKEKDSAIAISAEEALYKLPASEIRVLADSEKDASIIVSMQKVSPPKMAKNMSWKVVSNAVDFHVSVNANGKEQPLLQFTQYVERQLIGSKPLNSERSVAVRVNEDGTFTSVPTIFSGNVATMKSLTNSVYMIVENEQTFPDIRDNWAKSYIEKLASKYIIYGKENGRFAPGDHVTRAQFAVLLVRALGLPGEKYDGRFRDVKGNEWFNANGELMAAVKYGIVKGKENGAFAPNEKITRAQAAVMMERALKANFLHFNLSKLDATKKVTDFKDVHQIGEWSKLAIETMYQAGIFNGKADGRFEPNHYLQRDQMAKALVQFLRLAELM